MVSTPPQILSNDETATQIPTSVLPLAGDAVLQSSDSECGELELGLVTATQTSDNDLEPGSKEGSHVKMDVEHAVVTDDPRLWTRRRKGGAPIIWSAISEIKGRNIVYFTCLLTFGVGCTVAAVSWSMGLLIGMRIVQAFGAAAALTTGSGTIADMYEPHERGARVGLYYAFPLLGPALGPILGGALVQAWNWRATFWFMVIQAAVSLLLCLLMKDSFRKERSLAYIAAKKRASSRAQSRAHSTQISRRTSHNDLRMSSVKAHADVDPVPHHDVEKAEPNHPHHATQESGNANADFKLSIADVNPLGPAWQIMRQRSNVTILFASGLLFGFSYGICYTCAITFAAAPYSYDPLRVGAVLLSFGIGSVSGSVLGGRFSDRILARLKKAHGGVSRPEMRLESIKIATFILPISVLTYGWTSHFHVNVAVPTITLFLSGFSLMWTYSSTLTYIVDSNPGRASTGIAMNSCFRGMAGFIVAEISVPIRDAIGDGGLYSIWTSILLGVAGLMIYTARKGASWREEEESRKLKRALERAHEAHGHEQSLPKEDAEN
ncbi:hypothetical protein FRB98_007918 [Tulasnella sp. 332]|nr:hypothetical protein FRB98_007918 [Tulasnella sp. 332]